MILRISHCFQMSLYSVRIFLIFFTLHKNNFLPLHGIFFFWTIFINAIFLCSFCDDCLNNEYNSKQKCYNFYGFFSFLIYFYFFHFFNFKNKFTALTLSYILITSSLQIF